MALERNTNSRETGNLSLRRRLLASLKSYCTKQGIMPICAFWRAEELSSVRLLVNKGVLFGNEEWKMIMVDRFKVGPTLRVGGGKRNRDWPHF